jgi:type VI secretion system protein ImpF
MSASGTQRDFELSFFDRLSDLPSNSRTIFNSLFRDLTALLNSRRAEEDFDASFSESTNSLLTYGIVDFTSYNLKNAIDQERVRCSIERTIRQFEPRLSRVKVLLLEPDPLIPTLRFQIDALLRVGSGSESVLLDVALHRDSRRIAISGVDA